MNDKSKLLTSEPIVSLIPDLITGLHTEYFLEIAIMISPRRNEDLKRVSMENREKPICSISHILDSSKSVAVLRLIFRESLTAAASVDS